MRFALRPALYFTVLCWTLSAYQAFPQQAKGIVQEDEKPKTRVRQNDAGAAIPTRFDMLRGAYGQFRANNDLLHYHLDIRVDPEQKTIRGKNTIRFRML